jgi:hypothetical protein
MTEMPWALRHRLSTRLTLEIPVNRAHTGVHQTTKFWSVASLIHDFWMFDFDDGVRFLRKRQEIFSKTQVEKSKLTISSGERIPNWTSFTLRMGAEECANW